MSAIDEILKNFGPKFAAESRKRLISASGSIISGKLPESMGLSSKIVSVVMESQDEEAEPEKSSEVRSINMGRSHHGFVFDRDGTEKLISRIIASPDGELRIFDDLKDNFLFNSEKNAELWRQCNRQRSIVAKNIQAMMKETDVQYRTHGDRLHYLVIGKISFDYQKGYTTEHVTYPLTMFSCQGERKYVEKYLTLQVEKTGFINFVLDERMLDSELMKINHGAQVSIDKSLFDTLSKIQASIPKLRFKNIDNVEIDPTFSMIGVITGFETEYLDPVWEKIS